MKIDSNVGTVIVGVERRLDNLNFAFDRFMGVVEERFGAATLPVRTIKIVPAADRRSFIASFAGLTLKFQALVCIPPTQQVACGKVVCTLEQPLLSEKKKILGAFSYDHNGIADIEIPIVGLPPDIESWGPEIVMTFIERALQETATIE